MESQSTSRSGSSAGFSTYSGSRSSLKEIDDDQQMADGSRLKNEGGGENEDDKIHVAVERDFKLGKENLVWVIKNTPKTKTIVIVHVNVPAMFIPLRSWIPAQQLREQEIYAFRQSEKAKMEKALNKYVQRCSALKEVQAEKLVIEADDVGSGIVQLIAQHKITNLVMGAAADKNYSRKMREPRSKKALIVQKQADPSCKILFVCKGNLICTREASPVAYGNILASRVILSATTQPSGNSNPNTSPTHGHLLNFIPDSAQEELSQPSISTIPGSSMMDLPCDNHTESSSGSRDGIVIDLFDVVSRSVRSSVTDEIPCTSSSISIAKDQKNVGSFVLESPHGFEAPFQLSTSNSDMDGATLNDELYNDLRHAVVEANNLTHAAKEEALRHQKAVRDLHGAAEKIKAVEDLYTTEMEQRKDIEDMLLKETRRVEEIMKQRNEMFEQLCKTLEKKAALEQEVIDVKHKTKDLEKKLSDTHYLLITLQSENVELRKERDNAVREAEKLHHQIEELERRIQGSDIFCDFSYSELQQATNNFDESYKIREGGYGIVYKGTLGQNTVAIKKLNSQVMQRQKAFHKEINVLSKLKHPNLVKLLGACPEAWALVYDFLPNGSLEDRLTCKDNSPPLTWQIRIRVAVEICSALNFLHHNKCLSVVHGDLTPAVILLDANFISKLGDYGICSLVQFNDSMTLYCCTHAMGTFVYMDPEFLASGEITPLSDVYSYGIILLRLLTGRPPFGINRAVQQALDKGSLSEVLDASAGDWPYSEAEQLAYLGLRCSEITRKSRPDAGEALKMLEPLMKCLSLLELP
ncbi:U-box domain-containing protein 33-like [Zingiber officinale]|uniref:U-box domain-containing protein 33-like n=1 Tax=Zingiber officinale TaxID=94328 RepID=UPI001C4DA949|nr:U-box domain-containing protein 33-like [Zingiber officinale]